MNKKGNTLMLIVFICFVIWIVLGNIAIGKNSANSSGANLCSSVKAYSGLLERVCLQFEGEWICNSDKVGCIGFPNKKISCGGSKVQEIEEKCLKLGGEFTCDSTELFCEI